MRLGSFVCIFVCVCILQGKFEKVSTVKNDWGELKWKTVDTNGFDPFFLFLTFLPTILLSSAFDSVCLALSKWKKRENRERIMVRFKVRFYSNCECVWRNYFCYSPVPKVITEYKASLLTNFRPKLYFDLSSFGSGLEFDRNMFSGNYKDINGVFWNVIKKCIIHVAFNDHWGSFVSLYGTYTFRCIKMR